MLIIPTFFKIFAKTNTNWMFMRHNKCRQSKRAVGVGTERRT